MTILIRLVLLGWLAVNSCEALVNRLHLKNLVRHPCAARGPSGDMPIVLPKSQDTVILPDEQDSGCYTIGGGIQVKRRIGGSIQIYVETKYGDSGNIAQCKGATADNCGGVGSCVFCDTCTGRKDPSSTSVQLSLIGRKLDCHQGLNAGNYTDLGISFCLPTLDEYLSAQGISKDKWNRLYKNQGQTVHQTFYIFNEPINLLKPDSLKNAVATRRNLVGCDATVADVSED